MSLATDLDLRPEAAPLQVMSLWRGMVTPKPPRVTMAQIAAEVAERHNVSVERLLSHDRRPRLVRARLEAWRLIREQTNRSFPQIAAYFDGRDHSTICKVLKRRGDVG